MNEQVEEKLLQGLQTGAQRMANGQFNNLSNSDGRKKFLGRRWGFKKGKGVAGSAGGHAANAAGILGATKEQAQAAATVAGGLAGAGKGLVKGFKKGKISMGGIVGNTFKGVRQANKRAKYNTQNFSEIEDREFGIIWSRKKAKAKYQRERTLAVKRANMGKNFMTSAIGIGGGAIAGRVAGRQLARQKALEKGYQPGTPEYERYVQSQTKLGTLAGAGAGMAGSYLANTYRNNKARAAYDKKNWFKAKVLRLG